MLSISAVWPPEPSTTTKWLGFSGDGSGRRDMGSRLRTVARRKKQTLIRIRLETKRRRRSLLIGEREVSGVRIVVHVGGMSVERRGGLLNKASSVFIVGSKQVRSRRLLFLVVSTADQGSLRRATKVDRSWTQIHFTRGLNPTRSNQFS